MSRVPDERVLRSLLGVDRKTPWEEVRRAFREAVRASHPDLNAGDPRAEQRLKALNGAWESVNTPGKWAQYVLQGASDTAPRSGEQSRHATADPSLARLRVQRQRSGSAGLRRWQLELDGEVVATIENGATSVLDAGPGRHSVRIFYEWYSSRPLSIELHPGEELHLGCRQQSNPWLNLTAPKRSLALELLGRRRFA